ncbi:putative DNA-binding ribbon-helix-helix protein [Novosphingobium sp. ST904]|nr:putative DNA-binding ribbon-helix-helix protein [Novosphingobium sp. ST904]
MLTFPLLPNPATLSSMTQLYHPPIKRSIEIAGHKTSISLEPLFWDMLKEIAVRQRVPLNALVARIDADRLEAETPPGLASAIRVWLVDSLRT